MSSLNELLLSTGPRRAFTLTAFSLLLAVCLLELVCQAYALVLFSGFEKQKRDPRFYYQRSTDKILAYELRPSYDVEVDGRKLHLNRFGLREDDDRLYEAQRRIAIVGDSVTFGIGVDNPPRELTVPGRLQSLIDPGGQTAKVINCGIPGYSLREFPEFMRTVVARYRPESIVFVLNPNDFALRDTLYEGADNGLYRMYVHPFFKTPWMVRKLIYRMHKGGIAPSVSWYLWTFNATRRQGFDRLQEMARIASGWHADFKVVVLPAGSAYTPQGYGLQPMRSQIEDFLAAQGIAFLSPVEEMHGKPAQYFDATDHLTTAGNQLLSDLIATRLLSSGPRTTGQESLGTHASATR